MEYRKLGCTGLMVSVVSYGTAPLGDMYGTSSDDVALQSAYRALDAGINFFDSSPSYGEGLAEERLGKVLRGPGVMRVTPMGPDRTQVVWHEWFQLPGGLAGRLAWSVMWPGSKASLTAALKRFARLVEDGTL